MTTGVRGLIILVVWESGIAIQTGSSTVKTGDLKLSNVSVKVCGGGFVGEIKEYEHPGGSTLQLWDLC